jgi:hypothetical protein
MRIAAALLLVALTACSEQVPGATPQQATLELTPEATLVLSPELRDAIRVRENFGLPSDPEYVAAVAANPTARIDLIGIPLLPSEAAEMRRRMSLEDHGLIDAYTAKHRDEFGGLFIDQPGGGVLVVLFTDRVDEHRAAIERLALPGARVRVDRAAFTEDELNDAQTALNPGRSIWAEQGIGFVSSWVDISENRVGVTVKSANPDAAAIIEAAGPPGAIVVEIYPPDGPWTNAQAGDGWRLLVAGRSPLGMAVGYAEQAADLAREWTRFGLPNEPPVLNADEVALIFSAGIGSTCVDRRLDALVIDADEPAIYPMISDPLAPRGCTTDLIGGVAFVVAVARDRLPAAPFAVRLGPEPLSCAADGCPETELTVGS